MMHKLNYQELLKDPVEAEKEEALDKSQQTEHAVRDLERQQWLNHTLTKVYLAELENIRRNIHDETVKLAFIPETEHNIIRFRLIEEETLRKTLNLLKYGNYTHSPVN